jgi:hypothetical protein
MVCSENTEELKNILVCEYSNSKFTAVLILIDADEKNFIQYKQIKYILLKQH